MRILISNLLLALLLFPLTADAVEGDVWGTWTGPDTVYVTGEIRVPPGSTLVIEPGVVVNFQGHYKFIVDTLATLLAMGTESDSIYFTAEDSVTGWHGIRFRRAHSNSQIIYCRLEHGKASGDWPDGCGGAIYCYHSSPNIDNNTISGNSCNPYIGGIRGRKPSPGGSGGVISCSALPGWWFGGGGIYCWASSPTISNNAISGNVAKGGFGNAGGIHCCWLSNPVITNNTISDNSSTGWGGGIYSCQSSPTIRDNIISENSAGDGGGIYCTPDLDFCCYGLPPNENAVCSHSSNPKGELTYSWNPAPTITSNVISGNSANGSGGGIFCWEISPSISNNIISANTAEYDGGGIYCDYSSPTISSNTITRNQVMRPQGHGGGIYCFYLSSPTITNSILWGDTAQNGAEIYVEWSSPIVTYCDVQGGWSGLGNIDADPLFVDPENGDFHLQPNSPCIDTGDPELWDPDHSRSDMGALPYFFEVAVRINADDPFPITVPPGYDAYGVRTVANNTTCRQPLKLVTVITDSLGDTLKYVSSREEELPREFFRENYGYFHVADYAPDGFYNYVLVASNAETGEIWHTSVTPFEVSQGEVVPVSGQGWFSRFGDEFDYDENVGLISSEIAFGSRCYPNPFNISATISYQLPVSNYVKLEVYNLLGQKVAALVDERQEAGYKSVTWNASKVSSGVYFYKLTTGEFSKTQMMMLVK